VASDGGYLADTHYYSKLKKESVERYANHVWCWCFLILDGTLVTMADIFSASCTNSTTKPKRQKKNNADFSFHNGTGCYLFVGYAYLALE